MLTSVSAFALRRAGTPPGLRPLPIYSIYIKAKAVPVAASFSAVVSARPMRPDVRPRSVTALRIQDSSHAHVNRRSQPSVGLSVCYPKTHMLGAIAQLETELRAERQRDAIQNARARGVTCGRTKRLTSQQSLELWNRRQQGAPIKTLMADYGLSKASVYRYLSGPSSAPTATTE